MGWFNDLVERLKTEQAGNVPAENAAPVEATMEDLTAEVEARPSTKAIPTDKTDAFSSITDPKVRAYMRKQMEERKIAQQQSDENKKKVDLWRLPFQMAGAVVEGAARKPVGTYTPSWEKQYEEANRPLRDIEERQKAEMDALGRETTTGDLSSKIEAREFSRQLQDAKSTTSKERQDLLIQAIEVRGRKLSEPEKSAIRGMSGAVIDSRFKDLLPQKGEAFKAPRSRTRQDGRNKITEEESQYGLGDWHEVSRGALDAPQRTTRSIAEQDRFIKDTNTFVKKIDSALGILQSSQKISQNTETAVADVTRLYGAVKGIDWESVVREGEVGLFTQGQSLVQQAEVALQKLGSGGLLSTQERENLDKAVELLRQNMAQYRDSYLNSQEVSWKAGGGDAGVWKTWRGTRYPGAPSAPTGSPEQSPPNPAETKTIPDPDNPGKMVTVRKNSKGGWDEVIP